MHCPECNENNTQRKRFEKSKRCGCCNGIRNISFHRYVQYQLGWVCWLDDNDTNKNASIDTMISRCENIIEECYSKFGKKGRPIIKSFDSYSSCIASPSEIMHHYARKFKASDTKFI